jgi:uncharacterized protein YndB with AHSA1/START domain
MKNSDRIGKQVLLQASQSRVWQAIADARQFGEWFRVKLDGEFVVGTKVSGHITYPGYEHLTFELWVERMDAEHRFAFRWHPYAVDPDIDYSSEPTTLVEFELTATADGTLLTVVESGFDRIPEGRRAEAFRMNDGGWAEQMHNIEAYVAS